LNSETRYPVTLGADVGGKDAHEATNNYVLSLRRLLQQKCTGPYGATVKEFALVLRIDGSVQAWGKSGAENAAFRRKNTFATADIFVTVNEWSGRDAAHIRKVLATGVMDAIETLAELAERKKIDIAIDSLRRDVGAAEREFLA
jgi:hypothetical protein